MRDLCISENFAIREEFSAAANSTVGAKYLPVGRQVGRKRMPPITPVNSPMNAR